MKKKILSLLALCALMMSACGGGNNPDPSYDPDPAEPDPTDPVNPDPSGDDEGEWSDSIKKLLNDHAYSYDLPYFESEATGTLVGAWDEEYSVIALTGGSVSEIDVFVDIETILINDGFTNITSNEEGAEDIYYSYEKEIEVADLGVRTVMVDIFSYDETQEENEYVLPGTFSCYIYDSYIYSWEELNLNETIAGLAEIESINIPELKANKYGGSDEFTAVMYWVFMGVYPLYCYGVTDADYSAFISALPTAGWVVATDRDDVDFVSSDNKVGLSSIKTESLVVVLFTDLTSGSGEEGDYIESETFPSEAIVSYLAEYEVSVEVPAAVSQDKWYYGLGEDEEGEYLVIFTEDLGTPGTDSIEDSYLTTLKAANWIIDDSYYDDNGYYAGKDGVILQFYSYDEEFVLFVFLGEMEQGPTIDVPETYEGVNLTLADESCLVTKGEETSVWTSGNYSMTVKKGTSNTKVGNPGGGKEYYATPLRTYTGQIIEFTWTGDAPSMIIVEMNLTASKSVVESLTVDATIEGAEYGYTDEGIVAYKVNEGAEKVTIEVGGRQAHINNVVFVA